MARKRGSPLRNNPKQSDVLTHHDTNTRKLHKRKHRSFFRRLIHRASLKLFSSENQVQNSKIIADGYASSTDNRTSLQQSLHQLDEKKKILSSPSDYHSERQRPTSRLGSMIHRASNYFDTTKADRLQTSKIQTQNTNEHDSEEEYYAKNNHLFRSSRARFSNGVKEAQCKWQNRQAAQDKIKLSKEKAFGLQRIPQPILEDPLSFYERNLIWKRRKNMMNRVRRLQQEDGEMNVCTFHPEIPSHDYYNPQPFLERQQYEQERCALKMKLALQKKEEKISKTIKTSEPNQCAIDPTGVYKRSRKWSEHMECKRMLLNLDMRLNQMAQCTFEPDLLSMHTEPTHQPSTQRNSSKNSIEDDDDESIVDSVFSTNECGSTLIPFRQWKATTKLQERSVLYTQMQSEIRYIKHFNENSNGLSHALDEGISAIQTPAAGKLAISPRIQHEDCFTLLKYITSSKERWEKNNIILSLDAPGAGQTEFKVSSSIAQLLSVLSHHSFEDASIILDNIAALLQPTTVESSPSLLETQ